MDQFVKLRAANIATLKDATERAEEFHEFFVAGPFIDPDLSEDQDPNNIDKAHRLRHFLNKGLLERGVTTYLGEDRLLRTVGQQHYAENGNAVLHERHYILKHLDGVIILPSSPGSFCELGDWASDQATSSKTLILIDIEHQGRTNYINDGVVKSATMNGAKVEYLDYQNKEEALNACMDFVQFVITKRRGERLYGRDRTQSR